MAEPNMRIEKHHGNNIVCGHIYPASELKSGQRWQSSSGHVVTIQSIVNLDWVRYVWEENGATRHTEKDSFSFQCRYCLIVPDVEPLN